MGIRLSSQCMAQFCAHCGTQLNDEGSYCHGCGKPKSDTPTSGATVKPVILAPESEKTFFQDGTVTVTNLWFRVPGQDFAMSNVRAVRVEQTKAKMPWPTVLYLLGLATFVERLFAVGLILLAIGVLFKATSRPKLTVVLDGTSGEVRAFTSRDGDYISEIVDAIKKALAYRQ